MMTARSSLRGSAVSPGEETRWEMTARFLVVGDQQRLGLGVRDYHIEFGAREIGKNGHDHHASAHHRKITDAPVGHVAAQQSHLVAPRQSRAHQQALHRFDAVGEIVVSELLTFVHRESGLSGEPLHTLLVELLQR